MMIYVIHWELARLGLGPSSKFRNARN